MPIQLHQKQTRDERYSLGGDMVHPIFTIGPLTGSEFASIVSKSHFAEDTPTGVGAATRRELIVLGLRGWSCLRGAGADGVDAEVPYPGDAAKAFDLIANDWKLIEWLSGRIFMLNVMGAEEAKN